MKRLLTLFLILTSPLAAQTISGVPGWHELPGTALCGGGPQNNATLVDPANFPQNLNASYNNYGFDFPGNCYQYMEDANSAVMDTTRNRLLIWGGGHQYYHGNDFTSLELNNIGTANPLLVHINHSGNPNSCPSTGASGSTITQSDGSVCQFNSTGGLYTVWAFGECNWNGTLQSSCSPTAVSPGSVHSYEGDVYMPNVDKFFIFGGATAPNGNASADVWYLSVNTILTSNAPNTTSNIIGNNPGWTHLGSGAIGTGFTGWDNHLGVGVQAVYDPNTQGVWIQNQTSFYFFNPANNTITLKKAQTYGYGSVAAIDPEDQIFFMVGGASTTPIQGLYYYSIASGSTYTLTAAPVTPASCATALTTGQNVYNATQTGNTGTSGTAMPQYVGLQWDPIGHRFVIYPNGTNIVYYVYPKTWTCTQETYGTVQGSGGSYPYNTGCPTLACGTFGHFNYSPALDIFVLCNDPFKNCWYLRPKR